MDSSMDKIKKLFCFYLSEKNKLRKPAVFMQTRNVLLIFELVSCQAHLPIVLFLWIVFRRQLLWFLLQGKYFCPGCFQAWLECGY